MKDGFKFGSAVRLPSAFWFENDRDDRGRAVDSTQVKNGRPSPSRPSLCSAPLYMIEKEIPVD
jgi:hypothetical protein